MAPETYVEIQEQKTTYRLSKNPDGTLLLDCTGQITCIETFADGMQLAIYCRDNKLNLNTFFSKISGWDKALATQFAKGIYR